ncbi:MAG: multifunctional oxoglutarate decarboxylase/oxoglutarate dehydrogenase thiamine pyrophosphate-binding subunit/dihydrolipoyllysine-residue succinyltransferase subunit, partial [Actinobacteria bacterium]|nr:multifunctional oxoglutarate decarboxylase/oxoglutarate dehydrogenase thiamine pyrophosphate-binding subunit/dihydrolipoyllysine-residue succinyltransferase subunit [Actinomycetota bacterium]
MSNQTSSPFGANDWLVDELYQQYLEDKQSVDSAWWSFFETYDPNNPTVDAPVASAATPAAATPAIVLENVEQVPAKVVVPEQVAQPIAATAPVKSTPRDEALPAPAVAASQISAGPEKLKGPAARVVTNMEASLSVPTATSVRAIPAKLLIDNRIVINNHLARARGGKISFTHLIGYAIVRALAEMPDMNVSYTTLDDKPAILRNEHVNMGLAIDLSKPDGTRQLMVPAIKSAENMDFGQFWKAYDSILKKARNSELTVEDFQGITVSLTNPGTIGTVHSVPRLMPGQGLIVAVGAMDYPAEWQGASQETIARNAISKILTLTSTYDHRVIQGAQSGDFLRRVHQLLLGENNFYDDIFRALRIPYVPIRWAEDIAASRDDVLDKTARVQQMIHAYRVRGHLMADTDP